MTKLDDLRALAELAKDDLTIGGVHHYKFNATSARLVRKLFSEEGVEQTATALVVWEEFHGEPKNLEAKSSFEWGARLLAHGKDAEHSGDCTKQAWTCVRCQRDYYFGMARVAINALIEASDV